MWSSQKYRMKFKYSLMNEWIELLLPDGVCTKISTWWNFFFLSPSVKQGGSHSWSRSTFMNSSMVSWLVGVSSNSTNLMQDSRFTLLSHIVGNLDWASKTCCIHKNIPHTWSHKNHSLSLGKSFKKRNLQSEFLSPNQTSSMIQQLNFWIWDTNEVNDKKLTSPFS